jgi:hypothetical protein
MFKLLKIKNAIKLFIWLVSLKCKLNKWDITLHRQCHSSRIAKLAVHINDLKVNRYLDISLLRFTVTEVYRYLDLSLLRFIVI